MEFLEDYLISAGERDSLHNDMDCIWSFPPLETISSDECLTTAQRIAAGPRDSVRNGDLELRNSEQIPSQTEGCAEGFPTGRKGSESRQSSADVDDDQSDLEPPPAKRQVIEPQYRKTSAVTEKTFWEALRRQEQTPTEPPEPSRYYQRSSLRHQDTPPSSSESDSSPSPLPERIQELQSRRPTLYPTFRPEGEDSRTSVEKPKVSKVIIPLKNPNPLILKSKIATGNSARQVHLSEEERKLLIQEGLPVPVRYPLSKMDERNLKRIRRKIKNKISAQESRRKKKEYVDTLEEQMKQLENENLKLKERLKLFDKTNQNLISELKNMKQLIETGKIGSQSVQSSTR